MKPVLVFASLVFALSAAAQHTAVEKDDLLWQAAPPGLPPGAKMAVVYGDPSAPGQFYALRLRFPEGYKIKPHSHPADVHVTVLDGEFHVGLGDKFDKDIGKKLSRGGYAVMPQGTHHFEWNSEKTEVQVQGLGPFAITYVNPQDDPRLNAQR